MVKIVFLGFISLNQSLNNDQVLGVSYQYTYAGKTYQVGELSTDGVAGQNALFLKLLKSTVRNPKKKLWDLMMKNVYSLGAYQVDPNNFRLDIWYNNPLTSIDINYIPKTGVDDKLLIQLLDLDRLNQQQQMYQDGLFDFIPITSKPAVFLIFSIVFLTLITTVFFLGPYACIRLFLEIAIAT